MEAVASSFRSHDSSMETRSRIPRCSGRLKAVSILYTIIIARQSWTIPGFRSCHRDYSTARYLPVEVELGADLDLGRLPRCTRALHLLDQIFESLIMSVTLLPAPVIHRTRSSGLVGCRILARHLSPRLLLSSTPTRPNDRAGIFVCILHIRFIIIVLFLNLVVGPLDSYLSAA